MSHITPENIKALIITNITTPVIASITTDNKAAHFDEIMRANTLADIAHIELWGPFEDFTLNAIKVFISYLYDSIYTLVSATE